MELAAQAEDTGTSAPKATRSNLKTRFVGLLVKFRFDSDVWEFFSLGRRRGVSRSAAFSFPDRFLGIGVAVFPSPSKLCFPSDRFDRGKRERL